MDFYVNPVQGNDYVQNVNEVPSGQADQKEVAKEFTSLFLKNLLGSIMKDQTKGTLFGESSGYSALANEGMIDKLVEQISQSDAFGINKLVESGVDKNGWTASASREK